MRSFMFLVLLVLSAPLFSQVKPVPGHGGMKSSVGRGEKRVYFNGNRPQVQGIDCRVIDANWQPWERAYCEAVDFEIQSTQARLYGAPRPSPILLNIPAYGTKEAKETGVFCTDGRVIRKEGNSWIQAVDKDYNYLRCRPSVEKPRVCIGPQC
jgi:hypothetical protein